MHLDSAINGPFADNSSEIFDINNDEAYDTQGYSQLIVKTNS